MTIMADSMSKSNSIASSTTNKVKDSEAGAGAFALTVAVAERQTDLAKPAQRFVKEAIEYLWVEKIAKQDSSLAKNLKLSS